MGGCARKVNSEQLDWVVKKGLAFHSSPEAEEVSVRQLPTFLGENRSFLQLQRCSGGPISGMLYLILPLAFPALGLALDPFTNMS